MRKVLSAFLVASVLLLCAAPFFVYAVDAPFTINSSLSYDYIYNYDCDIKCIASDGVSTYAYMYHVPAGINFRFWHIYQSPTIAPGKSRLIALFYSDNVTYPVTLSVDIIDLVSGATTVRTVNITSGSVEIGPDGPYFDASKTVYFYSYTGQTSVYGNSLPFINTNAFVIFARPSSDFINVPFTKPVYDPFHSYFLDSERLYMIVSDHGLIASNVLGFITQNQGQGSIQTYSSSDSSVIYESIIPQVEQYGSNEFKFVFKNENRGALDCVYYISAFDINSGQLINCYQINVNAGTTQVFTFRVNHPDLGIWHNNLAYSNKIYNTPMIMVRWSDTIDYTSQLNSISSLLTTLYDDVSVIRIANEIISGVIQSIYYDTDAMHLLLTRINSNVALIWDKLDAYIDWLQSTFYNTVTGKWDITNNYLVSIYNLLNETDETMTIEDDTSGVAAMESAKNDLVITNSAGQAVDAGDAAAVGLSEAAVQIGEIAQPVSTINQLMQTIVFDKPKLLLPVIVALGLGLMVTILGKNKSD